MGQTRKRPGVSAPGRSVAEKLNRTKHNDSTRKGTKGNPSNKFLAWALKYAKSGFPVFPCESRGKAPEGRLAPNGYKDATTDPKKIRKWWVNGHDYNIGLVPPKGMAILDIDPRNGGERSWEQIQKKLQGKGLRSQGLRAFTGGGGEHIILANVPDRLPGKLAKGIDIKRNGYVIAEPSIHPDTGKRYRWVGGWGAGKVLDWPSDLKAVRPEGVKDKAPGEGREEGGLTLGQLRRLLKKISSDDYDDWKDVGMALKSDYPDIGFDLWVKWSAKSKKFPGERACRTKWRSFQGEGKGTGTIVYLAGGKVPRASAKEDFGAADSGVGTDDPNEAEAEREIARGKKDKKAREGELVLISLADVEEKQVDWLVPGYLAKGMVHCVAGYGGEGKSNVVGAIIASLTKGKNLVDGKRLPDGATKVLMVTEEPLAYQTLPRLRLAGADLNKVHVIDSVKTREPGKDGAKGKMKIVAWNLQDHLKQVQNILEADRKYRILVIDPIGSYMTGKKRNVDTWKDSDVRDVLRPWQELAEKQNVAVLFIAHFNKGKSARAAEKVTGSSAFTTVTRFTYLVGKPSKDWMDQFGLEPPREGGADRLLISIKRNVGRDPDLLVFSCDPVAGTDAPEVRFKGTIPLSYAGEAQTLVMEGDTGEGSGGQKNEALDLVEENPGVSSTDLATELGVSIQNLRPVMDVLLSTNKVVRVKKGQTVHWFLPGQEFDPVSNEDLLS